MSVMKMQLPNLSEIHPCNAHHIVPVGILFVKKPTRYLIKKYGYDAALRMMFNRETKGTIIDIKL